MGARVIVFTVSDFLGLWGFVVYSLGLVRLQGVICFLAFFFFHYFFFGGGMGVGA